MLYPSSFKPLWWLRNCHLQTIAAKWFSPKLTLPTTNEQLELPDGDFVDLAWTEIPNEQNTKPIVVILHGLHGSVDSHYVQGLLKATTSLGWIGLVMHFRGCSGRVNRLGPSYHAGDTRDIHFLTQQLHLRHPKNKLFAVGFSLGGNVLTNYLAEQPTNPYTASAVICAPLHMASCSDRINSGFAKVYQKHLVNELKKSTLEKIAIQQLPSLTSHQVSNIKTMRQFDHQVTAPINKFASADDYYDSVSGIRVIGLIKQPTLFIHSEDDPFLCHNSVTNINDLPEHIHFEVSTKGGHVGFIASDNKGKPYFWLERRIPTFLAEFL